VIFRSNILHPIRSESPHCVEVWTDQVALVPHIAMSRPVMASSDQSARSRCGNDCYWLTNYSVEIFKDFYSICLILKYYQNS
jgi:hypothetical protein